MDNLQIDELKHKIIELSIQCISDLKTQNTSYNSFHFELQNLLAEKSVLFNLSARREYPTILNYNKFGFIDLVWLDGLKPVVAFEIDSKFNIFSIWKLLEINSGLRFWVYYNDMTENEVFMFRGKNKDNLITLIKLPVTFEITPEEIEKLDNYYSRSPTSRQSNSLFTPDTILLTYNLVRQNLTIDEIANQRRLSRSTILKHVARINQMGYDIKIENFAPKEKLNEIRKIYPRHGVKWDYSELSLLSKEYLEGKSVEELAILFQRSPIAIQMKLENIPETKEKINEFLQKYSRSGLKWEIDEDLLLVKKYSAGEKYEDLAIQFQKPPYQIESRLRILNNSKKK